MRKRVKVFAAGCFNRIHRAHISTLQTARSLGDSLVVVLANDFHNKKPYAVPAKTRLGWMRLLGVADSVVVGKPHSFALTLRQERPDILVLGYDQRLPDAETERAVAEMNIEVVWLPWVSGKDEVVFP